MAAYGTIQNRVFSITLFLASINILFSLTHNINALEDNK